MFPSSSAGLIAALGNAEARVAMDLHTSSRVVVFGTEGDTDAALYAELVGCSADAVRAGGAA